MQDLLQDEFFIKMVQNPDDETIHYWDRWLTQHPERKGDFELAKQAVLSLQYKHRYNMPVAEYDQLFIKLRSYKRQMDEVESHKNSTRSRNLYSLAIKIAAVITFFLTFLSVIYFLKPFQNSNQETLRAEIIKKQVPYGAKNTIRLPDGSMVKLNAGSRLSYPSQFENGVRFVELDGEAFFDVVKDADHPFIIQTGSLQTEVLGTSFNVRSIQSEETIEVALVSGSVEIRGEAGTKIHLEPSEMAIYAKNDQTLKKQNFNARLVTGWKDNLLIFEKAPFSNVVSVLEKWYGVQIETNLSKPIVGLYSGEFKEMPLETVLEGIGYASGFQFNIDGRNVDIKN